MEIQAEPEMLKEILENIQIRDEELIVFVEGRKPRCFKGRKIGHARVECKSPREETETEGENGNKNEIPKETESSNQEKEEG